MNEGGVGLMVVGAAPRRVPASMRPPRVPASMEGLDLEAAKAIAAAATAAMDRTREAKRQRVDWAGMLSSSYYEARGSRFGRMKSARRKRARRKRARRKTASWSRRKQRRQSTQMKARRSGRRARRRRRRVARRSGTRRRRTKVEGNCSCDGEAGE